MSYFSCILYIILRLINNIKIDWICFCCCFINNLKKKKLIKKWGGFFFIELSIVGDDF